MGEAEYSIHLVPNADTFAHEASPFCPCEPQLTDDDQLTDPDPDDEDAERFICISYRHNIQSPIENHES